MDQTVLHEIVIKPPSRWPRLDLWEIWQYRDLLNQMTWRTISTRYRQSVVGIGWAVLRPVISMAIFTVIFGRVVNISTGGIPYSLFCFTGLLPWFLFSNGVGQAAQSLVQNSRLITKVYFPRLILPISTVATGLVDFAVQFVLLAVLLIGFHVSGTFSFEPSFGLLLLPLFVFQTALAGLALGVWLTALNVKYRDFTHLTPFLIQMWMWISPIVYPESLVSGRWKFIYALNPMTGLISAFRWSILGQDAPDWSMYAISSVVVLALFVSGMQYFRSTECYMADIV